MATIKQARLAKEIIKNAKRAKPLNKQELLETVGYTKTVATTKPGEIIAQKGVQEELEIQGFNTENAKKVVSEILNDKRVKPTDRLKASDQVFRVRGDYAAEKHTIGVYQQYTKEQLMEALMNKLGKKDK